MPLLSSKCKASHECCSRCRRHPGENHLGASLGWSVEVSGVAGTSLFFERFVTIKASHHSGGRSVLKHSDSELALRGYAILVVLMGPVGRWGQEFLSIKRIVPMYFSSTGTSVQSLWNQPPWVNLRSAAGWWTIQWCRTGFLLSFLHALFCLCRVGFHRLKSTEIKSQIWTLLQARFAKGTKLTIIEPMLLARDWSTFADDCNLQCRPFICLIQVPECPKGQPRWFAWDCSPSGWGWRNILTFATSEHEQTNNMLDEFNDDDVCKCIACFGLCSVVQHEATHIVDSVFISLDCEFTKHWDHLCAMIATTLFFLRPISIDLYELWRTIQIHHQMTIKPK